MVDEAFVNNFVERWVAGWNAHDADQLLSLCTDDIRWYDPVLPETIQGHEPIREFLASTWRGFPDLTFEIVGTPYVQFAEEAAALHWRVHGTMLGPIEPPGVAPTGARVEGDGMDLYGFRGGQLSEYTTVYDLAGWMRAMGLLPEPGSRTERVGLVFQRLGARKARRRNAKV
jgi:steroid delta-isomerase-like uncharacterized protein